MTRLIDADALINTLNEKNIPVDVRVNYEIMNAPTIEPDGDTISRSQAIKDISEWATDILHPDVLVKKDALYILGSLPSAEAEQVTGKLNKRDDSLLKSDSDECKEQKSKLDLISREEVLRMIIVAGECEPDLGYTHLHTVIESLPSAEPCDKDAISREGLLKSWEELSPRGRTEFDQVIMTIPALPSAEPKTGEWEPLIDYIGDEYFECSNCHDVFYVEFGTPEDNNYNFCPNCGSDMRKGDEEE